VNAQGPAVDIGGGEREVSHSHYARGRKRQKRSPCPSNVPKKKIKCVSSRGWVSGEKQDEVCFYPCRREGKRNVAFFEVEAKRNISYQATGEKKDHVPVLLYRKGGERKEKKEKGVFLEPHLKGEGTEGTWLCLRRNASETVLASVTSRRGEEERGIRRGKRALPRGYAPGGKGRIIIALYVWVIRKGGLLGAKLVGGKKERKSVQALSF